MILLLLLLPPPPLCHYQYAEAVISFALSKPGVEVEVGELLLLVRNARNCYSVPLTISFNWRAQQENNKEEEFKGRRRV